MEVGTDGLLKVKSGGSVAIDNDTITKNSNDQIQVAEKITKKLPSTAPSKQLKGKVPVVQNDGSVEWGDVQGGGGISPDDMLNSIDAVEQNTTAGKVVDALVVKEYANTYTERVLMTLKAGENTIGIWQDEEPEDWVVDEDHFLFLPNFYQADDEELTFTLIFDTSNNEPIFRKGFEWVSQTNVMKDGKPCGALCIRCANAPTVDTIIGVDITRVRFDNVIVVSP